MTPSVKSTSQTKDERSGAIDQKLAAHLFAAEEALQASEQRLAAQSQALTSLTARYADLDDPFDERLRDILVVSARALQVSRLSMWRFDEERQSIRCVSMFHSGAGRHESGALLMRHEAPAYFAALEGERVVAASDAQTDPRTREFLTTYLFPNSIGAMLDVPLRQNKVTVGVLCAEHIGGPRTWAIDEQNFAIATANLIAMALADEARHVALDRLAESNALAQLIVDTAHDAFVGVDSTGKIVTWNTQAEKTFGWTRADAIGRTLTDTIIPPRFRDAHMKGMRRFHETGEAAVVNQRIELMALHREGHEFPIEITITLPMWTRDGYFFGAFLRDISVRREHEDELRRAKESAEAATRAKSEFLANMSHELRTPLNGVLGYAQLLQRDRTLSGSQREALDAISKSGSHLLDLINDILDLSKIEAGAIDIETAGTDLAQLVIDLKYIVGEAARRKGLLLTTIIAADVPRRVVMDGRHVRQVLLNLLGNAIKFTESGEVRLVIEREGDEYLSFAVSDTGIGIESGARATIFEAFTQTASGAKAGGTGLGLAISYRLVKRMGNELKVESEPGKGSRFSFCLTLEPDATAGRDVHALAGELPYDARLAPGEDITALVVDDSTVNRRILAALLESAGVRVITAAGGREAVQLARENCPNVIFMDLKMGDLDGLQATTMLQADEVTRRIPVIAVTASALGDSRRRALEAGCVDYLPKPVSAEALFSALQTHLRVSFVSTTQAQPMVAAPTLEDAATRADVASRLRRAIDIGDVTGLEGLAQELVGHGPGHTAIGQQISRLVANLEFDGLEDLALVLSADEVSGHDRR
ncbi:MAG: ATP-binding protein [Vicinamibacterales bacterium]